MSEVLHTVTITGTPDEPAIEFRCHGDRESDCHRFPDCDLATAAGMRLEFKLTSAAEPVPPTCWCASCWEIYETAMEAFDPARWLSACMILCPDCGNKRCPKATHHDRSCTGSNEPGQPGSAYRGARQSATPERTENESA